ncbi:FG-GAP-like repeat-containing protein [Kitasatospora sp. NPDC007106]|uniref:FG-GAP-like repeat-containing protein n=1 Tax=Kitasatospora sp. NPDC007106 TaxID=3156914 RepID=UPI0033CF3821
MTVLGAPAPLAAASEPAANAAAPFAVEDGTYPGAEEILQATGGATLLRGDGRITYTSCDAPHQVAVWGRTLRTPLNRICFAAPYSTGYLSLKVPDAFRVESIGRTLQAGITIDGKAQTVDVAADTAVGVGEGAGQTSKAVLLELRVTGSSTPPAAGRAADPSVAFTTKLDIGGGKRSCTGALVDALWVATAKSCFADDPAQSIAVAAGAPKDKTTATIGRADLTTSAGQVRDVVELVPHADRDLVMARLAAPVNDIAPIALSTTVPTAGQDLQSAGYGRTTSAWVPAAPHTGTYTTGAVQAAGLDLGPKATTDPTACKGDAGAPLWRTENNKPALVAVTSRSWQGGCLGTPTTETRTGSYGTRVDDLGGWVKQTVLSAVTAGDANGDGRADALMAYHYADSAIGFFTSLSKADGGFNPITAGYIVPKGNWDWNSSRFIAGDFNGDHRTDLALMYHHEDGSITLHTGLADAEGHIQAFSLPSYTVPASAGWDWNAIRLYAGDANGDGRADAIMVYRYASSAIGFYTSLSKADGGFNPFTVGYTVPAGNWDWDSSRFIAGDFNGDHRTDLALIYHHGDNSITLHTGLADAEGHIQAFSLPSYTVPASAGWDWNAIRLYAGDANGDGRADAIMAYRYASSAIGFYTSLSKADGGFNPFTVGYTVPAGNWDWDSSRFIAGDFNGDHRTDLALIYHQGDGSITLHTGLADAEGHIQAFSLPSYTVPAGAGWDWNALQLQ